MKQEFYAKVTQNEHERSEKAKRRVAELFDETEDADDVKKKFMKKSMYELAAEMQNETMAPSLDSYGDPSVFHRYKNNKWFESLNVIELKRKQALEYTEVLKDLHYKA